MKRQLLYILIIIGTLFTISCSRDAIDTISEELVPVTFVLNGGEGTTATRAISDGTTVDQLTYAVYGEKGQIIIPKAVKHNILIVPDKKTKEIYIKLTVSLPAGSNYKAVFWLQNGECEAYSISDDMTLNVDYSSANNDEKRDAFWGVSEPFDVNGGTVNVTLKRPFAQVNAGAFPFDWEYVKEFYKFNAIKSNVVITGVANEMNLLSGDISGSVNANFTPGALPTEILSTDVDENGTKEDYIYLSMSYVLAGTESTTHSATFFYHNEEGKTVSFSDGRSANIQLQRNHRTDIIGQVLSNNGDLNVREYVDEGNGNNVDLPHYLYYNIDEPTTIENTVYNLNDYEAGMQFASVDGQTMTLDNLYFTGKIWVIELGEYRGGGYVNYNNVLNNVVLNDLSISACIECHEWYFSPAVIAYGNSELNNCIMKGTTSIRKTVTDKHGVHNVIPVDLGVRNESDAVINGGEYGTVFAWTHAVVDIHGADIKTLYCGTCDSTKHSWMTIHSGTTIDKVICCEPRCPYGTKEYSTTMTIKAGAKIGSLQLVSTDVEFLIIEDGAEVGPITCDGVEYTYEELRAQMGLD